MWIALACIAWGTSGLPPVQTDGDGAPVAGKHAVLEIMSRAPGDRSLQLEHHWGRIAAAHVIMSDHDGPFEAVRSAYLAVVPEPDRP